MRTEEKTSSEPTNDNDLHLLRRKIDEQQLTIDRLRSKVSLAHGLFRDWAKLAKEAAKDDSQPSYYQALHKTDAVRYEMCAEWMKEVL